MDRAGENAGPDDQPLANPDDSPLALRERGRGCGSIINLSQLRRHKPVWIALSELWLDTELTDRDLDRIARIMAESGFNLATLREIYLLEVAPVVAPNLLSVAGVWSGFDERWLRAAIVRNLRNRPRWLRFLARFPPARRMMTHATEDRWTKLVERVERQRAKSAPDGSGLHPTP